MKSPIDGHPGLFKDKNTNVIVNRADSDRERYRVAKQQARNALSTQYEISSLRREIDEIKSLLKQLIDK